MGQELPRADRTDRGNREPGEGARSARGTGLTLRHRVTTPLLGGEARRPGCGAILQVENCRSGIKIPRAYRAPLAFTDCESPNRTVGSRARGLPLSTVPWPSRDEPRAKTDRTDLPRPPQLRTKETAISASSGALDLTQACDRAARRPAMAPSRGVGTRPFCSGTPTLPLRWET